MTMLRKGTRVQLIDPNRKTLRVGILAEAATAGTYGVWTIVRKDGTLYRSEGIVNSINRLQPADETLTTWLDDGPKLADEIARIKRRRRGRVAKRIGTLAAYAAIIVVTMFMVKLSIDAMPSVNIPLCETEDSTDCLWDSRVQGNGLGQSFIEYDGNTYRLSGVTK